MSFYLSVLAIFSPFLDRTINQKFTNPSVYIWASMFIKCLRGCLTITVFILNNSPNDFYIGLFLLYTNSLGFMYFELGGLFRPNMELLNLNSSNSYGD